MTFFESADEPREFVIRLDLRVDLRDELAAFRAQAIGGEDESRRGADAFQSRHRGIRMFRVGEVMRNQQHESRRRVVELL